MSARPKISVALAACNGEEYLAAQVESILPQLAAGDELILSVNPSRDGTLALAQHLAREDSRVTVLRCGDAGVIPNFCNALRHCRGEVIFLSDQDDVWLPGKVDTALRFFENSRVSALVHGCVWVDEALAPLPAQPGRRPAHRLRPVGILWKNEAQGSCMALRREAVNLALPLPEGLPMHDSALALAAGCLGEVWSVPDQLLLYRRHAGHVSPEGRQRPGKMLRDRWALFKAWRLFRRRAGS